MSDTTITKPKAHHAVRHTVNVPVCTVEDFRAQVMEVILTEDNWPRFEPLLRKSDGGYFSEPGHDRWGTVHLWVSPHGMLSLLNYHRRYDREGSILTTNKVEYPKKGIRVSYYIEDEWVWESRSEWLDATEVVEAVGSKLWTNDPDDERIEKDS